jgi:uncharacterized membrane protein
MLKLLTATETQAVLYVAALLILMTIGCYIVLRFRDRTDEDHLQANEHLTNFREIHHKGDISDTEYRTIKTTLGAKLQNELEKLNGSNNED